MSDDEECRLGGECPCAHHYGMHGIDLDDARKKRDSLLSEADQLRREIARLNARDMERTQALVNQRDDNDRLRRERDHWQALAEERQAHANQLQADIEADQAGRLELRKRHGALDSETFGAFIERVLVERQANILVHVVAWLRTMSWRQSRDLGLQSEEAQRYVKTIANVIERGEWKSP